VERGASALICAGERSPTYRDQRTSGLPAVLVVVSDSERTRAAAGEAISGAILVIGGALLTALNGLGGTIGFALIVLGAAGAAHALLLGLGLARVPGDHESPQVQRARLNARRRR